MLHTIQQNSEIAVVIVGTHSNSVEKSMLQSFSKRVQRCKEFRGIKIVGNRTERLYVFPLENKETNESARRNKELRNIRNVVFEALEFQCKSTKLKEVDYEVFNAMINLKVNFLTMKKLGNELSAMGFRRAFITDCLSSLLKAGLLMMVGSSTARDDQKTIILNIDWFYALFSVILYDPKNESREFTVFSLDEAHDVVEYEESGRLKKALLKSFCATLTAEERNLLIRAALQFEVMKELDDDYYMVPAMAEMEEELPVAKIVGL